MECLFYDPISQAYFTKSLAAFTYALLKLNRLLVHQGWATVNDFYDLLGQPHIENGDDAIWQDSWIDISTERMTTDDGLEIYMLIYETEPKGTVRENSISYNERMVF